MLKKEVVNGPPRASQCYLRELDSVYNACMAIILTSKMEGTSASLFLHIQLLCHLAFWWYLLTSVVNFFNPLLSRILILLAPFQKNLVPFYLDPLFACPSTFDAFAPVVACDSAFLFGFLLVLSQETWTPDDFANFWHKFIASPALSQFSHNCSLFYERVGFASFPLLFETFQSILIVINPLLKFLILTSQYLNNIKV